MALSAAIECGREQELLFEKLVGSTVNLRQSARAAASPLAFELTAVPRHRDKRSGPGDAPRPPLGHFFSGSPSWTRPRDAPLAFRENKGPLALIPVSHRVKDSGVTHPAMDGRDLSGS